MRYALGAQSNSTCKYKEGFCHKNILASAVVNQIGMKKYLLNKNYSWHDVSYESKYRDNSEEYTFSDETKYVRITFLYGEM